MPLRRSFFILGRTNYNDAAPTALKNKFALDKGE
jgi:hypothetical protein